VNYGLADILEEVVHEFIETLLRHLDGGLQGN